MIMNYQAFAAPPSPNRTSTKAQRRIYGTPDGFGSQRPIDIIASARPILLLDEPQRPEGKATVRALPLSSRLWRFAIQPLIVYLMIKSIA